MGAVFVAEYQTRQGSSSSSLCNYLPDEYLAGIKVGKRAIFLTHRFRGFQLSQDISKAACGLKEADTDP
jgi:hypothetical protein